MVLSYWKDISHGLKPRKNLRGDPRRITKTRKICGTAVSKLHGRAPNPRARQRGGRAPVEVGDFPFLESIFVIFGNVSGPSPDFIPKTAISRRNDQRLPKSPPKILTNTEMTPKPPVANLRGRADPLLRSRGSWRARGAWGGTQITNFWCKPCSNKPMFSGVLSHVKCPSSSYRALASASRGSRGVSRGGSADQAGGS